MPGEIPGAGERLGPLEVRGRLGVGGMGAVLRAFDPRLGRDVAVKVVLDPAPDLRARFAVEGRAVARLDHPGIVRVHEAAESDGRAYLVMDLAEGEPLATLLARGRLAPRRAAEVGRDVARALAHAHARGVLHRDVKPANVMIGPDGAARLLDFGLARDQRGATLTRTGELLGTPSYMAPEQVEGRRDLDGRVDVWGLGATLHEALSGAPPFRGATLVELLHRIAFASPAPLPGVDPDLAGLVLACLTRDPARRPDANALARDLEAWLAGGPRRPRRRLALAVGLAGVALAAGAAVWRWSTRPPPVVAPADATTPAQRAAARARRQALAELAARAREAGARAASGDPTSALSEVAARAAALGLDDAERAEHVGRPRADGLAAAPWEGVLAPALEGGDRQEVRRHLEWLLTAARADPALGPAERRRVARAVRSGAWTATVVRRARDDVEAQRALLLLEHGLVYDVAPPRDGDLDDPWTPAMRTVAEAVHDDVLRGGRRHVPEVAPVEALFLTRACEAHVWTVVRNLCALLASARGAAPDVDSEAARLLAAGPRDDARPNDLDASRLAGILAAPVRDLSPLGRALVQLELAERLDAGGRTAEAAALGRLALAPLLAAPPSVQRADALVEAEVYVLRGLRGDPAAVASEARAADARVEALLEGPDAEDLPWAVPEARAWLAAHAAAAAPSDAALAQRADELAAAVNDSLAEGLARANRAVIALLEAGDPAAALARAGRAWAALGAAADAVRDGRVQAGRHDKGLPTARRDLVRSALEAARRAGDQAALAAWTERGGP